MYVISVPPTMSALNPFLRAMGLAQLCLHHTEAAPDFASCVSRAVKLTTF